MTNFDLKKYVFTDCIASQVKFEHCGSTVRFIGLKSHIKRVHPKLDLPRSGYFNKEAGCSCRYYFPLSKLEASDIDIDDSIETSKKLNQCTIRMTRMIHINLGR